MNKDNLPDFVTPIKLAYKTNSYAYFNDDAGNTLKIPLDKVPEFQAKLREKREPQAKKARWAILAFILLLLAASAISLFVR